LLIGPHEPVAQASGENRLRAWTPPIGKPADSL
jgi:hypothetical protein